ncbi:hypothetical protein RD792_005960 [Penstemon davidsonii]|uniref:Homeobox domain-containing protein n=1 Tax=Penstemon davidsonii TaxID=160366 RepID=A0ABR0DF00_9LAMI|nr:hypothetical protein RD792_005960 [Penstemon davidsonii]
MASFYSRLSGEGDMLPTSYMLPNNIYESQPSVSFSYPNFEAESQSNIGSRDEMLFIPPTSGPTGLHQIDTPRYSDGNSVISEPIPQYHGLSLSLGSQAQSLVNMPSDLNHYTNSSSFCSILSSDMQSELDLSQNKNVQYLSFDLVGKTQYNFQDLISSKETSFTPSLNLCNSKYLKAAQDLLDEVVNVREALKPYEKRQNMNSISQDGSTDVKRDGVSENHEFTLNASHDLTTFERHDLQNKVTKLLSMLDEVDRRYKQYLNQMQLVVSSFDMVAGRGSARPYTTLALQTISRQFRCLRDAIRKQIQSTQISLGEQDSNLHGQGVLSRLRFVDQQLRQQKAMQQFGIMRQPWRPQRGLPDTAVSVLRAWLFEHFLHPYPKDSEKIVLARQTRLSRGQVANWFINARVRLWKPMIEEMYKEEFGDAESTEPKFSPEQDCTNTMGSQVSLNLGLQHTEKDSPAMDCETRPKGNESLDKLEYYYVDPMNNQHRFANSQLLSDFVA